MPGCFKKGSAEAGRYCVKGYMTDGTWKPLSEAEFMQTEGFTQWLCEPIFKEYEVLTEDLPRVQSEFFNLNTFLEATKGHMPTESEWKQILMYLAKMQLDAHKAAKALNMAWGETSRENLNFLKRYQHAAVTVGEGSIRRYLKRYGVTGWEELEIFKKPLLAFRNDVEHFRGNKKVTYEELHKWFRETFKYTWGDGGVIWIYKEKRQERCGKREFTRVQTIIKNQSPFFMKMGKGIDYTLQMEVKEDTLDQLLMKLIVKEKNEYVLEELNKTLRDGSAEEKRALLHKLRQPAPTVEPLRSATSSRSTSTTATASSSSTEYARCRTCTRTLPQRTSTTCSTASACEALRTRTWCWKTPTFGSGSPKRSRPRSTSKGGSSATSLQRCRSPLRRCANFS